MIRYRRYLLYLMILITGVQPALGAGFTACNQDMHALHSMHQESVQGPGQDNMHKHHGTSDQDTTMDSCTCGFDCAGSCMHGCHTSTIVTLVDLSGFIPGHQALTFTASFSAPPCPVHLLRPPILS